MARLAVALFIGILGQSAVAATPAPPAPAATPSEPIIYSVSASPRIAHAGDSVKWDAKVSPNVVSVTARVAVYTFTLYPVRYGHFGEVFLIPKDVPPFFRGNYGVTVTATTASGAATSRMISLTFE